MNSMLPLVSLLNSISYQFKPDVPGFLNLLCLGRQCVCVCVCVCVLCVCPRLLITSGMMRLGPHMIGLASFTALYSSWVWPYN